MWLQAELATLEMVCAAGRPAGDACEASVFVEFAASDPHLNTAVDRTLIGLTDIDLPVNAVAPCDDTVEKHSLSFEQENFFFNGATLTTDRPVVQQFRNRVRNRLF